MNLFYVHPNDVHLPHLTLRGQEARHASKVLRYREGDELFATDGRGNLFRTKIVAVGREQLSLHLTESRFEDRERPLLILCLGLIKKRDRLEFAVEKAVELGVNEIVIFKGEHSQKENVRTDRLEATALAAMKQSLRYYLPEVSVLPTLAESLEKKADGSTIVVADETTENTSLSPLQDRILLIVGPEGGFSEKEREELKNRDSQHYSLGQKRFRTETAAIIMTEHFRRDP